uniref:DUF2852 domain-containing protein n=1 Tax=Xinfangfangia pollutisoli TaxID=2865960 RepID=UPI001CD7EE59|nr:DUF2852 domain-containing protein [Xinfangfangia pollutisoli]
MHSPYAAPGLARSGGLLSWPRRAEAWLDRRGRAAWIVAMVLGFMVFWPIGLFLVLYITITHRWSQDMFGHSCRTRRGMPQDPTRDASRDWARERGFGRGWGSAAFRPSGNAAFDDYKTQTLRRLEDEQEAFEGFLQRLRAAKDKTEFDAFMEERARVNRESAETAEAPEAPGAEDPRRGAY